ncbi:MAG TPA: general stress protein [Bryobacteraceae bacterium]|jgi:hypothetical protein
MNTLRLWASAVACCGLGAHAAYSQTSKLIFEVASVRPSAAFVRGTPENVVRVAVYNSHVEAEEAVDQLKGAGFDMTKLSIVGEDYHTEENMVRYYDAGDCMKYWGKMGAFGAAHGACSSAPRSFYCRVLVRCW